MRSEQLQDVAERRASYVLRALAAALAGVIYAIL